MSLADEHGNPYSGGTREALDLWQGALALYQTYNDNALPLVEEAGGRYSDWDGRPDIHRPDVVVYAESTEEVSRVLEFADARGLPVVPFGAEERFPLEGVSSRERCSAVLHALSAANVSGVRANQNRSFRAHARKLSSFTYFPSASGTGYSTVANSTFCGTAATCPRYTVLVDPVPGFARYRMEIVTRFIDERPVPWATPIDVGPGSTLRLEPPSRGLRTYLCVAGGLDVPMVLGSRTTYLPARLGGVDGRALRPGDELGVVERVELVLAVDDEPRASVARARRVRRAHR